MHDEPLRCRTNIRKRIASDQGEFVLAVKSHFVHIMRIDDFERTHAVIVGMGGCVERDFIALLDLTKRPEERVTMARDDYISWLAWPGRTWNVTKANTQGLRFHTFLNNDRKTNPGNLETGETRSTLRRNLIGVLASRGCGGRVRGDWGRGIDPYL